MHYLVLARKYRPQTLEEVAGQDHVTTTLHNAIAGNRVHHAYLFTGARGVGKTSSARILAKALNCATGPTVTPCGECENCKEIANGNSLDVFEIDAASNTGVDNVRELQEGLRYMPGKSRFKVYIVDEVHMLSGSAFNALLKTLEEPPEHVRFIFATTEPHKIPVTILSRCQRFDFKRLSRTRIVEQLKHVLAQEKVEATDGALQLLAREAEGSMRDALSLTDQALSFGDMQLNEQTVSSALGVIDSALLSDAARNILAGNPDPLLEVVDRVYDFGYDVKQFTKNMLEYFRNLLVVKVSPDPSRLVDLPEEDVADMKALIADTPIDRLHRLFSALLKLGEDVTRTSHPRMVLEVGLIRIAGMGPLQPVEELLGTLRDLGNRPPPIAGGLEGAYPPTRATAATREPASPAPSVQKSEAQPRPPRPEPRAVEAPREPARQSFAEAAAVSAAPSEQKAPAPASTPVSNERPGSGEAEGFVPHLRDVDPKLAAQLQYANIRLSGDRLSITIPEEMGFLMPVLTLTAKDELAQAILGYFKRPLAPDVQTGHTGKKPDMRPHDDAGQGNRRGESKFNDSPKQRERREEAKNHPAIREVLKIFESGRIKDIHALQDSVVPEDTIE